ncbi:MAG: LysM peptidoglycan-binding domain-containing protein [Nitrospirae bacterium]|nr:LysM peptidoglycan-binding domain-containing protein [Nitrospirota bacterium]
MKKTGVIYFVLIVSSFFLSAIVLAQSDQIRKYTIEKGDTLWDISGKELNDHFLWPKIWKENPEIANPDRVYPGQTIRLPLYSVQKDASTAQPDAQAGQAAPPKEAADQVSEIKKKKDAAGEKAAELTKAPAERALVDKNLFVSSGYITDAVTSKGKITGAPSGKNLFGNNDTVYVKTHTSVMPGDKFYVIRANHLVKHPLTNKRIGYLVEILGIAEISGFENGATKALITHCFNDINSGDLVDLYYEMTPPIASDSYRKPYIRGVIIASKAHALNSAFDVVYIDKGSKDGIETGDLLKTEKAGEPKVPNGVIQIIQTKDNTATAIIRKSTDPVTTGNFFTHLE